MQYDHNSERLTFDAPKTVDEHDMTLCDRVEIHFINIGSNGKKNDGVCHVETPLKVKEDDSDKVEFTWLVSQEATMYAGTLSFAIRFICTEIVDGISYEKYRWNTAICNSIAIGAGISSADKHVIDYEDILGTWYHKFLAAGDEGVSKINESREKALEDIRNALSDISIEEIIPMIEEEKEAAVETIHVQADEIVNIVLSRLPRAEEASF
jgi:hypothetical protein